MGALEPLLTRVLADVLTSRALEPSGKWKAYVCLAAMTGLLLSAGFIFMLMALYAWLATQYDAPIAAVITGAASFTLAGLASTGFLWLRSRQKSERQMQTHDLNDNLVSTLVTMADELDEPIAANPRTAVMLAGLAGYIAGDRLR